MTQAKEEYLKLHRELGELIKQGKGDSEEADALRDKMDGPWFTMEAAEQDEVRKHPYTGDPWVTFLAELKGCGGSTDMQTSKTGRYPYLFHFKRDVILTDVIVYPYLQGGKVLKSPPRDWSTLEKLKADYQALKDHGGSFNDTKEALDA